MEPKPLQLTAADLAFLDQRQFSVRELGRFRRPHKLGAELMRGINVDQVNQDYVNNTVMPDLHLWEQKFGDDWSGGVLNGAGLPIQHPRFGFWIPQINKFTAPPLDFRPRLGGGGPRGSRRSTASSSPR